MKFLTAIAIIVVALVIAAGGTLVWEALHARQQTDQQLADIHAAGASQQAATAEGHDAVQLVTNAAEDEAVSKALTEKNTHAIEAAPGAEAPVSPDLYNAAIRALCLRHVYYYDPRCVRLRHPSS